VGEHLLEHLRVDRVAGVGAVELQQRDPVGDVVVGQFFGHIEPFGVSGGATYATQLPGADLEPDGGCRGLVCIGIGAFATSEIVFIKELGFRVAVAVLIDATIVRALVVPS
jgi:hypothetical protein